MKPSRLIIPAMLLAVLLLALPSHSGVHYSGHPELVVNQIGSLQAALDQVAGAGGGVVRLVYGSYSTNATYTLGDNTTLIAEPGTTITVTGNGTTLDTIALDNIDTAALFTNEDHSGGNSYIRISGLTIDFDTSTKTTQRDAPDRNYAAIHFGTCTNSVVENCVIDDVMDGISTASYWRAFGILFTDSVGCIARNNVVTNCGYEGVSFRRNCEYCTIDGLSGGSNVTHFAQVTTWIGESGGSPNYVGIPKFNTFRNIRADSAVTADGIVIHGNNTGTGHMVFTNCNVPRIEVLGVVEGVNITDCHIEEAHSTGGVYITPLGLGALSNVTVTGLTANPSSATNIIRLTDNTQDGGSITGVSFVNCNIGDDGKVLIETTSSMTIDNVEFIGCTTKLLHVDTTDTNDSGSGGAITGIKYLGGVVTGTDYDFWLESNDSANVNRVLIDGATLEGVRPVVIAGSDGRWVTDIHITRCVIVGASTSVIYGVNGGTGMRIAVTGNQIISAGYIFKEDGSGGVLDDLYHSANLCTSITAVDGTGANAPAAASVEGDGSTQTSW